MDPRQALGRTAEDVAARHLERIGLRVLERNVRSRQGELDLVCRDGDVVVFVEVKCRRATWGDGPAAAVSWQKQRRLARLALAYLKRHGLSGSRCRFDVVAVTLEASGRHHVRHLPGAFDAPEG